MEVPWLFNYEKIRIFDAYYFTGTYSFFINSFV